MEGLPTKLGLIVLLFICHTHGSPLVKKRSTVTVPPSKTTSVEAIHKMQNFFSTYSSYEKPPPVTAESSDAGNGATEDRLDPLDTPELIESILEMQRRSGIAETGTVTEELLELASHDRCGVSDPIQDPNAPLGSYTVRNIWESKYLEKYGLYELTFSLVKPEKIPPSLTFEEVEQSVLSAMCLWEMNSNLRFRDLGKDNPFADVMISFEKGNHGDKYNFDGTGGTLAHAFYPENGKLHFDESEYWYMAKRGAVNYRKKDIFTVTAHELGHNIGLMHSDTKGAIMAPVYNYTGTFEDVVIPPDDISGIESMYGVRKESNVIMEADTACNALYTKYKVVGKHVKLPAGGLKKEKLIRREVICEDDTRLGKHCPKWVEDGFCIGRHANTMKRRCKKSCGFCSGTIPQEKPGHEDIGKLTDSACGIEKFDSVAAIYEGRNLFAMYYFKDDYYLESEVRFDLTTNGSYTLLDNSPQVVENIIWHKDPRATKRGIYKYNQPTVFEHAKSVSALLVDKTWYLLFEKTGEVRQYTRGTPSIGFMRSFELNSLFPGYEHSTVDAAFAEFEVGDDKDTIYTLFKKDKMFQFKVKQSDKSLPLANQKLEMTPIQNKTNVDIVHWHGIPACDIDSVFEYKGVPYFLKDGTFWPAVATEEKVPRDLSYNFLRCWTKEPRVPEPSPGCNSQFEMFTDNDPENGATGIRFSYIIMISFLLLASVGHVY